MAIMTLGSAGYGNSGMDSLRRRVLDCIGTL
nr:hypothetical protein SHINE37_44469 [Rhizobiaceae bacterium]